MPFAVVGFLSLSPWRPGPTGRIQRRASHRRLVVSRRFGIAHVVRDHRRRRLLPALTRGELDECPVTGHGIALHECVPLGPGLPPSPSSTSSWGYGQSRRRHLDRWLLFARTFRSTSPWTLSWPWARSRGHPGGAATARPRRDITRVSSRYLIADPVIRHPAGRPRAGCCSPSPWCRSALRASPSWPPTPWRSSVWCGDRHDADLHPGLGPHPRLRRVDRADKSFRSRTPRRPAAAAMVHPRDRADGADSSVRTGRDVGVRQRALMVGGCPHRRRCRGRYW